MRVFTLNPQKKDRSYKRILAEINTKKGKQVRPGQVQIPSVPSIHIMCVFPSEVFLPMEKSKVCISTSTQPRTLKEQIFQL